MQTGVSINQDKVFKAHGVPQGLCGNLICALKLLANQQEDGDDLIQNKVTNLGVRSRKGLRQRLREFIEIHNQRALEVGYLSQGMEKFKIRRPKGSEGYPEVTVRESPDELTLRAEEVCTWKTSMSTTMKKNDGVLPWLITTGMPSVRRCTEASKEKTGEKCMTPIKK